MPLSERLRAIVDALPLEPGMRVIEVGCGSGAAAREVARRIGHGHVLAIDRSARAIALARAACAEEIADGRLSLRQVAARISSSRPARRPTTSPSPSVWERWTVAIRKRARWHFAGSPGR